MRMITTENLTSFCIGAAILGSGGGGDTDLLEKTVHQQLLEYGPVNLMPVSALKSTHLVIPIAFVGSPEATRQLGVSAIMFSALIDAIKTEYPDKELILMPAEIGGSNALTPFVIAGMRSMPVLDADLIGRAFPKVSMCKPAVTLKGQPIVAYMSSVNGECVKFIATNIYELEQKARAVAMQYGGSAAIATFLFDKEVVDDIVIAGSISRALELGENYRELKVNSTTDFTIANLKTKNANGFFYGSCSLLSDKNKLKLYFQNEYLCLKGDEDIITASPELIVLMDQDHLPIAAESLANGMSVKLLVLEAPAFWYTAAAKKTVALDQFELDECI